MSHPVKDAGLLVLRAGVGGVLIAHGCQKLFGWFGGGGLNSTAGAFESMGFTPGRPSALAAGLGEAGGGALIALGLATPVAGAAAAGTMIAASSSTKEPPAPPSPKPTPTDPVTTHRRRRPHTDQPVTTPTKGPSGTPTGPFPSQTIRNTDDSIIGKKKDDQHVVAAPPGSPGRSGFSRWCEGRRAGTRLLGSRRRVPARRRRFHRGVLPVRVVR